MLLRQHEKEIERKSCRHRDLLAPHHIFGRNVEGSLCGNRLGKFQVAKVGHAFIVTARTDTEQLNLGDDETVTAAVVTHTLLQVSQSLEVFHTSSRSLSAHASVPLVEGLADA